jgi:2'-5' RNA ligase
MRLFTAIDLPAELVATLDRVIATLRPSARLKWSDASNLHITLKFIGEWREQRLDELNVVLRELPKYPPIPVHVRKLGFFPNPHSPRVFWAGIEAASDLGALARDTDRALAAMGVASEQRAYSPHLTLGRIKERVPMQPLRESIAGLTSLDFGSFIADRFYLYHSRLSPSGSVYTKLAEFPLSG